MAVEAAPNVQNVLYLAPEPPSFSSDEEESVELQVLQICAGVASSIVEGRALPPCSAACLRRQLPGVVAASLAVLRGEGRSLRSVALVGKGSSGGRSGELAQWGEAVVAGTAAWQAYRLRSPLVWTRSRPQSSFLDWRRLLSEHPGQVQALVTLPLLDSADTPMGSATFALAFEPGVEELQLLGLFARGLGQHISHLTKHMWETSLGFLNQVLPTAVLQRMVAAGLCARGPGAQGAGGAAAELEPSTPVVRGEPQGAPIQRRAAMGMAEAAGEEAQALGQGQEGSEGSWEAAVSSLSSSGALGSAELDGLGVPVGETPGSVAMGGAAAVGTAGVAAEADTAPVPHVAPAGAAGAALGLQGGKKEGALWDEGNAGAAAGKGAAAEGSETSWSASGSSEVGSNTGGAAGPSQGGAKLGFQSASALGLSACEGLPEAQPVQPLKLLLPDIELEGIPQQKWTLEFSDPRLEELYKTWFNSRMALSDLVAFRSYALMLLLAVAGLLMRGSLSIGTFLFCCQVFITVGVPAYLVVYHRAWYIKTRSFIVGSMRIASCVTILAHSYWHPELYADSLLKALCGNCALTMALNTFRNELRVTNHIMSQLLKLYMCAVVNGLLFSDPQLASQQYLTLGRSTLVQLVAVLLPSVGLYRQEALMRRAFVQQHQALAAAAN